MRRTHLVSIFVVVIGVVALTACSPATTPGALSVAPTDSPQRATQIASEPNLMRGQAIYDLRCAHCHGYGGEGQLSTTVENTRSLGMHIVPSHDATGHTWEHPDQLLLTVIQQGIRNPLDQYPMPAFESVLSPEEIEQVLDYLRLWWTDEQRNYQADLTQPYIELNRELGIESEQE